MKTNIFFCLVLMVVVFQVPSSYAQGYDPKLTIQGMDKQSNLSAVSTALGGTVFSRNDDPGLLFINPVGLAGITQPVISLGNMYKSYAGEQVQHYAPAKYVPLWSLLMEGLTSRVPPHDSSVTDSGSAKMPRPYDDITPGWKTKHSKNFPLNASIAYPFEVLGMKAVAAAGAGQYVNMYHAYQNNNVMSPAINNHRPFPLPYVVGNATFPVEWYQSVTKREGSINRYGGALAVTLNENLAIGVSGAALKGNSDDYQSTRGRGHLIIHASYLEVDSVDYITVTSGTSDYSGMDFRVSGTYSSGIFTLGMALCLPQEITRKVAATSVKDTAGVRTVSSISGEEKISFPLNGTLGLSLALKQYLTATLEYNWLPYSKMKYTALNGTQTQPWADASNIRVGVQFTPLEWLSFHFGAREQSEVFAEIGNALEGETVSSQAYSAGISARWMGVQLNLAYEYYRMFYNDMLSNTIYKNKLTSHNVMAEARYSIPVFF